MIVWYQCATGRLRADGGGEDNAGLQTTSPAIDITVTTNLPAPEARIAAPMSGARFPSDADIHIVAAAGERDGAIATVEFLAGGASLGVVTNNPAWAPPPPLFRAGGTNIPWRPFSFLWTNAPVGSNTVTALATDNNGTQALSAPVTIVVLTNSYHRRYW